MSITPQELVSSTLQPNLAPEGAEEEVMEAAAPAMGSGNGLKHRSGMLSLFVAACGNAVSVTEVENPLLHNSEPVEIVGAIGEGSEAGFWGLGLECFEVLSLPGRGTCLKQVAWSFLSRSGC